MCADHVSMTTSAWHPYFAQPLNACFVDVEPDDPTTHHMMAMVVSTCFPRHVFIDYCRLAEYNVARCLMLLFVICMVVCCLRFRVFSLTGC